MSNIRDDVRAYLSTRPDLTVADLVPYTNLAESTCRGFVSNGQVNETPRIKSEMEKVLRLAKSGEILSPGGAASAVTISEQSPAKIRRVRKARDFYITDTVRRVGQVFDYCHEQAAIGVVTGDFGVGKTEAMKAWRRGNGRNIDCAYFEFDEFSSSNKISFIRWIAESLGVSSHNAPQYAGTMFRAVCDKLQESPCLLIFDQCEMVRTRVFQIIRQIWDRTHEQGVGVVLLSAPMLLSRMKVTRTQDLGALTSRVGIWAPLNGLSRAEMAAIVKQEGVMDIEDAGFDLWWKATAGSMRRLMMSLDLIKARHSGKRVTETTVAGVAGHLWGMNVEGA